MEFLNHFMLPVILGICFCVGYVVKKWIRDIDNKYIPTLVAVLGVFLSAWLADWNMTPEILLTGMVSGLASTGFHQAFKQFVEAGGAGFGEAKAAEPGDREAEPGRPEPPLL